jgi:tetratricopeptide (TPR) repeat protein
MTGISSETPDSSLLYTKADSLILRGIEQTFDAEFDSALSTFQELDIHFPDRIVGTVYQAATLQSKMMDFEADTWEESFYELIDRAIIQGKKRIKGVNADAWDYYHLGNAYTYSGLYEARKGNYLNGFFQARKGVDYLRTALTLDSSLYDAYLGIGSYKYWSGQLAKYFSWLPWVKDERLEGVELVKKAVKIGKYSHWIGINNLAWIEYDRQAYDSALTLFQMGLERFPESRFFLWGLADTYLKMEKWELAIQFYKEILRSIQNEPNQNGYNEIVCRFKIVKAMMSAGDYKHALYQSNRLLKKEVNKTIANRLKDRYSKTRKYRRECVRILTGSSPNP